MKRNNIIIASGIAALPFLYWGVKSIVDKVPIIKKEAIKHQEIPKEEETQRNAESPKSEETPTRKRRQKKLPRSRSAKRASSSSREESVRTALKDKEVGQTDDGRSIYQGGKGGKYTISDSGKKIYLKK